MSLGRWCVAVLCLGLAVPAASQQARGPDIVVSSQIGKKKQSITWKRAESEHVVVFSQGSDEELVRVSRNLERLYHLMSRIYRRGDQSDATAKVQVTLIDSGADFRAMGLDNLRSREGPYINAFTDAAYYDPREDGAVIAVSRASQIVDLNTNRAYNLDCDDQMAEGVPDCIVTYRYPALQTWQQRLYAAYARHFLQTYAPAAYPRWYLDGVGVLFSTLTVRANGSLDYAQPPENYGPVFRAYGNLDVRNILTGRYLDAAPDKRGWTPYHAWLLTHYFVMSPLKPDRARQFQAYMTAISRGEPMAEAAKAFGDMGALQRDVFSYIGRNKLFARTERETATEEPLISVLSPAAAAMVPVRLELGARLAADDPQAVLRRDGWIAQLRDTVAKLPYDTEAELVLTEAECRAGHAVECQADAQRVLAASPDNVRALAWKGVALTDRALTGAPADRAARLILARAAIERAIALDDDAPLPLIAWFESYARAGEPVPDAAMAGMAKVIRAVPAAPAPRLYLAEELQRQGKSDVAQRLVDIVRYGAYDSPEKQIAVNLFK
ncbi:MAG: hypothetical protein E7773_11045 [Sphingomonas sp.]|uniref:hypothetical protein n=1 Tax=Sphingomonas sp. TaxID=28214 RepID=UPI0012189602|nr:hypothetical protein [Sphingomonas sp.]THD35637.1 MAG: hypothetical protein E7773_11045 [Sphingomonas sp.]